MAKPAVIAVDDDPAVVAAVVRDLRVRYGEQYRVLRATSGAEALEILADLVLKDRPVAAVVTDQRMPGMSGIEVLRQVREQPSMVGRSLVAGVSCSEPYVFADEGDVDVAVVDYGVKRSVLRRLAAAGARVTVYPQDVDTDTLTAHDGVLLSPGPGDPAPLVEQTRMVGELVGRANVLGICLGHQLLAQATGHETFKLPFGHRGTNHPVLERESGRVLVTSQNHGFAVRASEAAEESHVSLYDGTVEGLSFPELRARSLQFHPEAGPGPHDAWSLLEQWVESLA
jgi:carbamoyl-phosphate synthase small subunit